MEKRVLLAIILSFMILYSWSMLTYRPSIRSEGMNETQLFDSKEDKVHQQYAILSPSEPLPPPSPQVQDETTADLETDKFLVKLTNRGGAIKSITTKEFQNTLPLTDIYALEPYRQAIFNILSQTRYSISYGYEDDDVQIIKEYKISETGYEIFPSVKIVNKTEMSKNKIYNVLIYQIDLSNLKENGGQRAFMMMEYSVATNGVVERKHGLSRFSPNEDRIIEKPVDWIGFRDQYFCLINKPEDKIDGYYFDQKTDKILDVGIILNKDIANASQQIVMKSFMYYGPQDLKILRKYDNLDAIIDFHGGGFVDVMAFGLTDFLARILLHIMNFMYRIIPNWGVAIIIMACLLYAMTYPFTYKSMKIMKENQKIMQVLQPEINKIREKYKNNSQKSHQALMELYKKHNFNPLSMMGGCLPLFLQMPIFISLVQLLWRYYEFKGADFLWIKDLAEPDRLFILPVQIPIIGNEINILPIIYAVLMAVQQNIQTKNMVTADPSQAEAQRLMARIFPFVLCFLFYKFASGVALYFSVYFLLNAITQIKINREAKAV